MTHVRKEYVYKEKLWHADSTDYKNFKSNTHGWIFSVKVNISAFQNAFYSIQNQHFRNLKNKFQQTKSFLHFCIKGL